MKQALRSGPAIAVVAMAAIACGLGLGAVGYWKYATTVPPFTPHQSPMPQPNGYEMGAKAAARLAGARRPNAPDRWPKGTMGQLRAQLAPVHPMLDQVRSSFRLEWHARPILSRDASVPESPLFRECARCFAAESILARHDGDYSGAMERSLDALELGSRVPKGGSVFARRIGMACHSIGFEVVEALVPRLPSGGAAAALKRVRRVRQNWPPLAETLECERVTERLWYSKEFEDLQRQPLWQQFAALRPWCVEPSLDEMVSLALTPRRTMLEGLDQYWQRRVVESKKPFPQRTQVPTPDQPWLPEILSWYEDDPAYTWEFEWPTTQFAILEVALAVRLYRLKHGRYPVNLRAIEQRWLPAIPSDQWDQQVAYCLKRGKPVVYSLGPDGKDDGGQAANVRHLGKTARGDLVFGKLTRSAWPEKYFYGPQSGER